MSGAAARSSTRGRPADGGTSDFCREGNPANLSLVKLTVKSDYAARAVLELARAHASGAACKAEELAAAQNLPVNYLIQILIELKAQHLVRSLRGKDGGYLLARPPREITLGDVLRAVHGEILESPARNDPACPPELRDAWERLQQAANAAADSINFQDLLDRAAENSKMYYI
jgi:Rrf2 family protein